MVTVFMPLAGALLLSLQRHLLWAGWLNILISTVTLGTSVSLALDVAAQWDRCQLLAARGRL